MKLLIEIKAENEFMVQGFWKQIKDYLRTKAFNEKIKLTIEKQ